jgi:predicted amidohydrolase YtcJ
MPLAEPPATVVFRGGPVFRADPARSIASAVAIRGDRIVAVGGEREIAPHLADASDVVDLRGRFLLPGFVDAHVHPIWGGLERLRCDLTPARTLEEYRSIIARYAHDHPDRPWVQGGGWAMQAFPAGLPTRQMLDDVVADRPVYLPNRDHHSVWVNTRALEVAGVDAGTPDPPDGRIERDSDGRPTGALHEGAADLVAAVIPSDTADDLDAGLREGQRYLHSLGVVGWQDAIVRVDGTAPTTHDAYLQAQREGWLTARVVGALWWDRSRPPERMDDQIAELIAVRDAARGTSGRYSTGSVKIMQDGVAETFTAAMLEPYLDRCGHPGTSAGLSFLAPHHLSAVTAALDAAGFQVHFHALGDRAVREVLDALQAARDANGTADRRHHLAHLQVVDPVDLPRFRRLGAAANLQALWAAHEPQMDELTIPFLGEARSARQYPFADLVRHGATLAMGSDWPVTTPDPLAAIHVAVNRIAPDANPGTPPLSAEQRLPLSTALAAYTAGSAWVNHDRDGGSIAVGNRADLVLLDRDPFEVPAAEIAQVRAERTYVAGDLVHCR